MVAVTGDDEDNLLICQVAKEKYLCERIIARVNNPRNLEHFKLLGHPAGGVGDRPDPAPDRARGAALRARPPARPARGAARDHRARGLRRRRPAAGKRVLELDLPEGALVISVLRNGSGFVPKADTVVESGDEVLVVLDPGLEDAITAQFVGDGDEPELRWPTGSADILIVGGGLAGASCAEALRERGLRRLGAARGARAARRPYERPPCSKDLLRGESAPEDALLHPHDWYGEQRHRAADAHERDEARPEAQTAALSTRDTCSFDRALLATGANVRRLRVDGGDLDGIHYLRAPGNLGVDPARRRGGRARGADRRLLHRLRGGGLADHDGQALHARDARGRAALDRVRRRGGRFFAGPARRARDRVRDRRPAGALRGRGARAARRDRVGPELDADLVVLGTGATPT